MDPLSFSLVLSLEGAAALNARYIERAVHRTVLSTRISEQAANWGVGGGRDAITRQIICQPPSGSPQQQGSSPLCLTQTFAFKGRVSQDSLLPAGVVDTFRETYTDRDDTSRKFATCVSKASRKLDTCADNSGGQQWQTLSLPSNLTYSKKSINSVNCCPVAYKQNMNHLF